METSGDASADSYFLYSIYAGLSFPHGQRNTYRAYGHFLRGEIVHDLAPKLDYARF